MIHLCLTDWGVFSRSCQTHICRVNKLHLDITCSIHYHCRLTTSVANMPASQLKTWMCSSWMAQKKNISKHIMNLGHHKSNPGCMSSPFFIATIVFLYVFPFKWNSFKLLLRDPWDPSHAQHQNLMQEVWHQRSTRWHQPLLNLFQFVHLLHGA